MTAQPLCVLTVGEVDLAEELRVLVARHEVERIVVGLPISLSGRESHAAEAARQLAKLAAEATGLPVELFDERFTTKTAEEALISAGVSRDRRKRVVDKVAAAVMLGHYLEGRR